MKSIRSVQGALLLMLWLGGATVFGADVTKVTPAEIRGWLASPTEEIVLRLTRILHDAQATPLPVSPRVLEETLYALSDCPVRVVEELEVLKQMRFMIDYPEERVRHAALRAIVLRYRTWKAARELVQGIDAALVGEELYRWACEQMHITSRSAVAAEERLDLILQDVRRQWTVMRWMPGREARRRLEDWVRFQPGVRRADVASETVEIETVDGVVGTVMLLPR